MATQGDDTPADYDDDKPNHLILWLDENIGDPTKYIRLKKVFSSNTNPCSSSWEMLNDQGVDHLFLVGGEGMFVDYHLQAFQNVEDCIKAFEEHQDKRIFFITSGSLGQVAVPQIIERFRHVFTDPITNENYPSIYIFCYDIGQHIEWAMDYVGYVQGFDFDADLLERLTKDIAEYFIEQGKRLRQGKDYRGASQRLHWAKKLWHRYDKMSQEIDTDDPREIVESQQAKEINEMISEVEQLYADQQRAKVEEQVKSDPFHYDDDTESVEFSS